MIKIISHIEYLLRRNECVVLPEFGAFIARYVSAKQGDDNQLLPPARVLGFNEAVVCNDGLLVNSIMRKEKVSYDKAMSMIADDVVALKRQLVENHEFRMGSLGRFELSDDDSLHFYPSDEGNQASIEYFGLEKLKLTPVISTVFETEDGDSKEKTSDVVYLPISRNIFKIVASIAVLILLAITLSTPIPVENTPDFAGFNSTARESVQIDKAEKAVAQPMVAVAPAEDADTAEAKDVISSSAAVQKPKTETALQNTEKAVQPTYYVVVASLKTKAQTEQFIKESSIKNLKVLSRNGSIYRVYVASGNSYAEMNDFIESTNLRETNPDVWICKR